ncbi:hypothetical protein CPB86DRAFT_527239 [Serendipita vermifera]|nr:hypothetical protein CPB86DRAFT_527239 [Serendipita vermifera]
MSDIHATANRREDYSCCKGHETVCNTVCTHETLVPVSLTLYNLIFIWRLYFTSSLLYLPSAGGKRGTRLGRRKTDSHIVLGCCLPMSKEVDVPYVLASAMVSTHLPTTDAARARLLRIHPQLDWPSKSIRFREDEL